MKYVCRHGYEKSVSIISSENKVQIDLRISVIKYWKEYYIKKISSDYVNKAYQNT